MSGPIWVCDPTGNNNPYLKIKTPSIFVACQGATYNSGGFIVANAKFLWSENAVSWNNGNFDDSAFPVQLFGPDISYSNGSFLAVLANDFTEHQIYLGSNDGKKWTLFYTNTSGGLITISMNTGTNPYQWELKISGALVATFLVPNALTNPPNPDIMSQIVNFGPLADSLQSAALPDVTNNNLPTGITAIRYGTNSGAPSLEFDYSRAPITTTVVNGGVTWPGANWKSGLAFTNAAVGIFDDTSSNEIVYAASI